MSGVVFVNSLVAKATKIPSLGNPMWARGDRSGDWLGLGAKRFLEFCERVVGPPKRWQLTTDEVIA